MAVVVLFDMTLRIWTDFQQRGSNTCLVRTSGPTELKILKLDFPSSEKNSLFNGNIIILYYLRKKNMG